MAIVGFKTAPVSLLSAKHNPGRLKNPNDPNGGRWEDSYYLDAGYMGGKLSLFTRALDVFQKLQVGQNYCFAGEVLPASDGKSFRLNVMQVFAEDGRTPVAGMPAAATGK